MLTDHTVGETRAGGAELAGGSATVVPCGRQKTASETPWSGGPLARRVTVGRSRARNGTALPSGRRQQNRMEEPANEERRHRPW
jgi:hypothetical protein